MLKEGWKGVRLGDVINCKPKISLKKGEVYDFIEMSSVKEGCYKFPESIETKEYKGGAKFEGGDTIFARITPCLQNGKITKVPEGLKGFGSTEYFVFRGLEGITDNDYVFYLLINENVRKEAEQSMVGASGRQRANINVIEDLEFSLPPLPTQKRIASILSNYDDLIENNTRRIKILEEQAQALYRQWFVEFKFPGYEEVKMIESGSEFGDIPEGWEVKEIGEVGEVKGGKRLPKGHKLVGKKTDHPYIRVRDFHGSIISLGDVMYINNSTYDKISRYVISSEDIYVSIAGTVGLVGIVPSDLDGCNLTENAAKIVLENKLFQYYIYQFLCSDLGQDKIKGRTGGSSQPKLALYKIESIPLLIPSIDLLQEFYDHSSQNRIAIQLLSTQNTNLKKQRDALLPRLVSGEILVD